MESKIFQCVNRNDAKGLESFKDHPNLFQIRDASGRTILQIAINENKIAVFKFLLSLDSCLTNTRNREGKTVSEVALRFCKEKLKENRSIRQTFFLRDAIVYQDIEVAKLLIEKGADLNRQDDFGNTPLHVVYRNYMGADELLSMMLYFGDADLSIPNSEGLRPIDYAFIKESLKRLSESEHEHLVFSYFDDYSTGYDIPLGNLLGLLQSDYSFVPQVLKHITSINLDKIYHHYSPPFDFDFGILFTIKSEYLKLLLEKFDYAIEYIINGILEDDYVCSVFSKKSFIESFDLLFQSRFGLDLIQIVNKSGIFHFMGRVEHSRSEYFNFILLLLSYGAIISDEEVEKIYKYYGDCEFFRTLLHMDIKFTSKRDKFLPDLMPALFYDIGIDLETFLNGSHYYKCSEKTMEKLLDYFAHPKLKDYCLSFDVARRRCLQKMKNLPSVPLLEELARNKVREFLIKRYKIENSMQFYTIIKHLPISKVHEKIITLETKLYENYHK